MSEPYYYSDEAARLQVLLEEVTRARPGSPENRFIKPDGSVLDRLASSFHHVVYGRRGTGKSSLLRHIEAERTADQHLVAWADQETYMGLEYPDVLVSTLADSFADFAEQLRKRDAADGARERTRQWRRRQSTEVGQVASQLEHAVAQLLSLKQMPSESQIEWTASFSQQATHSRQTDSDVGAAKGWFSLKWGRNKRSERSAASGEQLSQRFVATKAEHLEKAVPTYRALMKSVTKVSSDSFIILDDFYRLREDDQPRIAGYLHRSVKDTGVWLKLGSIRYWTRLYAGGSPSFGLQVPHDIRELTLDRNLPDFNTSKRFLEQILEALAEEAGVDTSALFSDGARDRLVLASGGVARDYIGLASESIAIAKNRGPSAKAGTERVIAEDINEAAGRTVDVKYADLEEDAGADAAELRELVIELTTHCRRTRSACFLVDFRDKNLVTQMNRLQNMRFVHAIDSNESLPDQHSSRYNVYVLDVSQLAAQRAWQVDFMGWTKREKRRARKLVFPNVEGESAISARGEQEQEPEQLSIDDALAVVGSVDPPVESPSP